MDKPCFEKGRIKRKLVWLLYLGIIFSFYSKISSKSWHKKEIQQISIFKITYNKLI